MAENWLKRSYRLYDRLNDKIREEGNKVYVSMSFIKRLGRLAVLAHQRYRRGKSVFVRMSKESVRQRFRFICT